ncbi:MULTISPECIES: ATP synthase F1 subunit delta [Spirosoma]|uniref:ATP synthase subunit delta n=2 Tax=Spirosoma TaxID=107 RepID=A0A6G9AKA4_9BACT|nr:MULTISPECIES: ATP synthase F1 subunit delta [Spirosoma]QHV97432.1 ATP synthase F1 subunit delta [Spirosoma endbachense]QIP12623.1 ATP synthase F1 subunit delta [Spirosoma aureum]
MAVATVASRYAKSLLDLAQEQGITETLYKDMRLFKQTVDQSRPLLLMLKNPIVRSEKKSAVLKAAFEKRLNPVTMSFLQIITKKNREPIMDAIAEAFITQYDKLKGVERATVITTVPLTDALREKFKAIVLKTTGGKLVELEEKIDQKLIGGYVLRVGDQQIDGSIRNQLNELRLQFLN